MAEWLILLLALPAILAPVVLLVGFAGCSFEARVAAFVAAFERNLVPGLDDNLADFGDEGEWEGYTLVQRIDPALLSGSGTQVRLTLRASATSNISIDRIYISQLDSGPASDLYDSAPDLTEVYDRGADQQPLVLQAPTPPGQPEAITLSAIAYPFNHEQPLLIAVDFSVAPPSALRYRDGVEGVVAYWRLGAEAEFRDRSAGYTPVDDRLYLIEKIEVV